MYLNSFNSFRGIAILFIVAGHCLYMSGWAVDDLAERCVANLVLGGTSFFVFISGFLFHHIFYPGFNYRKFMLSKIKNVLSPYMVMSLPLVVYSVAIKGSGPFPQYFFTQDKGWYAQYLLPVARYLWTGRILEAYWYIPFIMIIFAASPLFVRYIRMPAPHRLCVLAGSLMLALFVQRPVLNISVMQSVVYFLPVYLLGIVASIHRERIYSALQSREIWLLAAAIFLALLQSLFYDTFGNLHKPPFLPAKPDLLLVQKIFFCMFFMVFLHRFEQAQPPSLRLLAGSSFAIYFIHPYLLWILQVHVLQKGYAFLPVIQGIGLWLFLTLAVVLLSMAIAVTVRNLLPRHSRLLIGW